MTDLPEDAQLARAVVRLKGTVLGLAAGTTAGLVLFLATNWLVFKGGDPVGPHLALLSQFFIGYSVTFAGSFVGMAYAFATGYLAGWFVAWVYNRVLLLKQELRE